MKSNLVKKFLTIFIVLFIISSLFSKTFIREYTYNASEVDSKITSRAIAIEQVKRILLEEIGIYIHSNIQDRIIEANGKVKEMTSKDIEVISAGILETKILEERWDGEKYYIKVEIKVDEDDVIKRLDNIVKDKQQIYHMKESIKNTDKALNEIKNLKEQLKNAQTEIEKLQIQKNYNQISNDLSAEDWFQKGEISYKLKEYENAIFNYLKTIELNPNYSFAYSRLGMVYGEKGMYKKAINYCKKGIKLQPNITYNYASLGAVYCMADIYDKAIEIFRKSIEISPDGEIIFTLGQVYQKNGNFNEAEKCYQKAIEYFIRNNRKSELAPIYSRMGQINISKNNEKAIEYYKKALNIDPKSFEANAGLGLIYDIKDDFNIALEYYKKAINFNPFNKDKYSFNNDDLYCAMGRIYVSQNKFDESIKCGQEALNLNPNNISACTGLASIYAKMGNAEKSIYYVKRAARLGDKDAQELLIESDISW